MTKLSELFSSLRFWMLTIASASLILTHYFPSLKFSLDVVAAWLAAVTGIRTIESVASKVGGSVTAVGQADNVISTPPVDTNSATPTTTTPAA